jgi:hypothetical protein
MDSITRGFFAAPQKRPERLQHGAKYHPMNVTFQASPVLFLSESSFRASHFDRLVFNVVLGDPPLYRYRSLERSDLEIRILKLHTGNHCDIVRGSIIYIPISQAQDFEAISYRWSSVNEIPILLDGQMLHV